MLSFIKLCETSANMDIIAHAMLWMQVPGKQNPHHSFAEAAITTNKQEAYCFMQHSG